MNIHFEDKELFEELKKQTIFSTEIGSRMYGTNNEDSDTDILYIYVPSYNELNSVSVHAHQYQYKENGVDHIFTDIYTFIKNSLNGDSTINFEVINSTKLKGSDLDWLYEWKHKFRNYKILRAYLGRARKDLKQMRSKSDIKDITKKLSHAIRCYTFAVNVLENDFKSEWDDKFHYDILARVRNMTNKRKIYNLAHEYEMKISVLRERVNFLLDSGKLGMEQYASVQDMAFIDMMLRDLVGDFRDNNKESNYFATLSNYVYDAVANGIEYENSKVIVK
jgi:predicted nucleotidyltransferase